jgi:hypothetical protein
MGANCMKDKSFENKVPADGIGAAINNGDFGTSRWQLSK